MSKPGFRLLSYHGLGAKMPEECSSKKKTDRYVSFLGIDCNDRARKVMERIDRLIVSPERSNAFWDYFCQKRSGLKGPKSDDLFLIHSSINQVRELFETWEDEEGLRLLDQLETECC